MILETDRLILRPWRDEDLAPYAAMNADPEVMRFYPEPYPYGRSLENLQRNRADLEARGWGWWALELKGEAPFIGFVGLAPVPAFQPFAPAVETGWRLLRPYWGRGLAPEGAREALRVAFGELGLEEVVAFTAVVNGPSRRVMEKLGMIRDPRDDFHHPRLAADHPLGPHVLYRIRPSRTPR